MKTISILLLLLTSCSAHSGQESGAESREQQILSAPAQKFEMQLRPVSGDRSEPLFAETINEMAEAANLPPLKPEELNGDDLEFRVWVGFGKKPLEGFVIRRAGGRWEGTFLSATVKSPDQRQLSSPESGWEQMWSQLVASGLLTLPDSSKDAFHVLDGTSYVVELKKDGVYRTYAYPNPDYERSQEAKQMLRIAAILYTGFGIERYPAPEN